MSDLSPERRRARRLVEDALWEPAADDMLSGVSFLVRWVFKIAKRDKEFLGRYILRERVRKYREGQQDAGC